MRHSKLLVLLLSAVLVLLGMTVVPNALSAQPYQFDEFQGGRTYVIAFPDTTANVNDKKNAYAVDNTFLVYLYSAVADTVTIVSGFGNKIVVPIPGGIVTSVDLSKLGTPIDNTPAEASINTYRLEAPYPFLLYCYMVTQFGAEAWTPLPVEAWGTDYYAAALPGEVLTDITVTSTKAYKKNKMAPAEIMVIAAYDGTMVSYRATDQLLGEYQPVIQLNANEAFIFQSYVDTSYVDAGGPQPDLGGTFISSNRPISVVSGNTRAQVTDFGEGISKNSFKNMLMESLAPTDQHGTEFVYTPTWDPLHLTGASTEDVTGKRASEFIRVYGTNADTTTGTYSFTIANPPANFSVLKGGLNEMRVTGTAQAVYIKTDKPAQAVMNSNAAIEFVNKSSKWGAVTAAGYEAAGAYMVDLTPREQWISFAPFYCEPQPGDMKNYINIVTDAASVDSIVLGSGNQPERPFLFSRGNVAGTDLVWGTMELSAGLSYYIRGKGGVKFTGYVYGLVQGFESFKAGSFGSPGAYYERVALAYGYPLAPMRRVLAPGDSLQIEQTMECTDMSLTVHTLSLKAVGMRSITLSSDAKNARIVMISPSQPLDVVGARDADFKVVPIDRKQDATATVVIKDRSGKVWSIPYTYYAERVTMTPTDKLDFGKVFPDSSVNERSLTIANPLGKDLPISTIALASGNRGFTISRTEPANVQILKPGEQVVVWVSIATRENNRSFADTLRIGTACTNWQVPLTAVTAQPCIKVDDLDFGQVPVNTGKTLGLTICNDGGDTLRFTGETQNILSGLSPEFYVSQQDLSRLKAIQLGPGKCVAINVTFSAADTGTYRVTARLSANTTYCGDTSIWVGRAISEEVPLGVDDASTFGYALQQNDPNPFSNATDIVFSIGRKGYTSVEVFDGMGRTVAVLTEGEMESGTYLVRWIADGYPSGTYYCRITSGDWTRTRAMILRR